MIKKYLPMACGGFDVSNKFDFLVEWYVFLSYYITTYVLTYETKR